MILLNKNQTEKIKEIAGQDVFARAGIKDSGNTEDLLKHPDFEKAVIAIVQRASREGRLNLKHR